MLVKKSQELELSELKLIANYISGLPPEELRSEFPKEMLLPILNYWYWVGRSINAFHSRESSPLKNAGLPEEFSAQVNNSVKRHIALATLLITAEPLLREEAQAQDNPHLARLTYSDILKIWCKEECFLQISLLQQSHWESHTKKQNDERRLKTLEYIDNEVSDEELEIMKIEWAEEDKKLNQSIDVEDLLPLTNFCLQVFKKHRRELPEAYDFVKTWYRGKNTQKFTVVNGIPQLNPVRGKDKGKRKAKSS
jgi:hypothetical protein